MNNNQVFAYGLLLSTNDLRSIFVGHIHFKKLMKFRKFIEIYSLLLDQAQEQEIRFLNACNQTANGFSISKRKMKNRYLSVFFIIDLRNDWFEKLFEKYR